MVHLLLVVIYLAFISLGLPDGLLGAAWPTMYPEFGTPISYAGIVSMIICLGTVLSSLFSDRLTRWLGTGKVTAMSVAMTSVALIGFSMSDSFWLLCLWAIPYGLGAGSVDACLNNYIALHYSSRHMSWLHCMWGIGASVGPYIMGHLLAGGRHWSSGYLTIAILQLALTVVIMLSLPMWKKLPVNATAKPLSLFQVLRLPGANHVMVAFFCYCALEQTAGLWGASYLMLKAGFTAETAASLGSLFYLGITVGRGISGFLAARFCDNTMVRIGFSIIGVGVLSLLLPLGKLGAVVGLVLVGLGCAPIYPCVIHSTPEYFGADRSQALIGVQMASAYIGTAFMPPLFGLIADYLDIRLLGGYLLILLIIMALSYTRLIHVCRIHPS